MEIVTAMSSQASCSPQRSPAPTGQSGCRRGAALAAKGPRNRSRGGGLVPMVSPMPGSYPQVLELTLLGLRILKS